MVITERLEHLDGLATRLQGFAKNIIVLKGGMTKKERTAIFAKLKAIPNDAERLILATGKYICEGFDDSRLDTLFLLLPISFESNNMPSGYIDNMRERPIFGYTTTLTQATPY